MRSMILKHVDRTRIRSVFALPFILSSRRSESQFVCGLHSALARKGVFVKDESFRNLKPSELRQKGATVRGSLFGLPLLIRGKVLVDSSEISKAQFVKLLKQVTNHLSSVSSIFIHDGAISSSSKLNAKVRMISDSCSAILTLSSFLIETSDRAVSHDSCPLTVYVAASLSPSVLDDIGFGAQGNDGFIAADVECASLILCGNAFSDSNGVRKALMALSEPIICARGGLLLHARLLISDHSTILLFAPDEAVQGCIQNFISPDAGIIFSSFGVAPLFPGENSGIPNVPTMPHALVLVVTDSSGSIPLISELSPGQAAYHFLAGYQNGKFVPAYAHAPSPANKLALATALLSMLKENRILSLLINVGDRESKHEGMDIPDLVKSALTKKNRGLEVIEGDIKRKYEEFMFDKFQRIPEELSF